MVIVEYNDWFIEERDGELIFHDREEGSEKKVVEVYRIEMDPFSIDDEDDCDITECCPCDYDCCGELYNEYVYAFYAFVD